ncbi:MAG: sugar phosphate nucleotidyltransferase [Bdellovibrionota bacterium]
MGRSIVIIAAGAGSRIESLRGDLPKPLVRLCGLSLIERSIKSAKRKGFDHFVIVVGYQADQIKSHLGNGKAFGVSIDYVHNDMWQKKNGLSLLQAKDAIAGDEFVLLMSDHVLDQAFFEKIRQVDLQDDQLVLLTDAKINQIFDIEDATKVQTHDGYITNIGKEIESFSCIDTGVFVIAKSFFDILASKFQENGDFSLSEGVFELVANKKARVFDIGDLWWQDVDTPETFRHAEKTLLRKQIKPTDVFVSRYLNRPISLFFSRYLLRTSITPNQATYISMLSGLISLFSYSGDLLGVPYRRLFYHMASVLDGCDGEIARLTMKESVGGEWVDTIIDNLTHLFFVGGLSYGLYKSTQAVWPFAFGLLASVSIIGVLWIMFRYIHKQGRGTLFSF